MANEKIIARQYNLSGVAKLTVANLGAGNGVDFVIPAGALLLRAGVIASVAFDSGTTATATVTDGTTVFVNAQDIKTAAGFETAAVVGKYYPTGGTISCNIAETGTTATAGECVFFIEYVRLGSQAENQF